MLIRYMETLSHHAGGQTLGQGPWKAVRFASLKAFKTWLENPAIWSWRSGFARSNYIKHWNTVVYGVCKAGICQTMCKLYTGSVVQAPEHSSPVSLILYADTCCLIASWELRWHVTWLIFQTLIVLFSPSSSSSFSCQSPSLYFVAVSLARTTFFGSNWKTLKVEDRVFKCTAQNGLREWCFCRSRNQPSPPKLYVRLLQKLVLPKNIQSLIKISRMRKVTTATVRLGVSETVGKYAFCTSGLVSILRETVSGSNVDTDTFWNTNLKLPYIQ